MKLKPAVIPWDALHVGMSIDVPFTISADDMEIFRKLSGDYSRIHHDVAFAKKNGFNHPVVYGALTVSRLSQLFGMHIPGDLGLATSWKIDFNNPLYVEERAVMHAVLTHKSEATHTIKIKFDVTVDEKIIATGAAGSKLLNE